MSAKQALIYYASRGEYYICLTYLEVDHCVTPVALLYDVAFEMLSLEALCSLPD